VETPPPPKGRRISKTALIVLLAAVIATSAFLVSFYELGYFNLTPFSGATMHFTIYEADPPNKEAGMNGSYWYFQDHPFTASFPIITVPKGTMVIIQIINNASSEPHGFAIDHYFNSGTTVRPHESYTLQFVANQVGTFRIYCNVFCSIHPFMQNGQLQVTSS
jgi:heme/copper-type cytochrome/quinol oxidase subunit 2